MAANPGYEIPPHLYSLLKPTRTLSSCVTVREQTNVTLGRANNRDLLFCLKPIKKHMSKTASVLDTGTSGSTPVGYHDLPWPSAASGTPGLLEPASASIAGR